MPKEPTLVGPVMGGASARAAVLPVPVRDVHRSLLRHFATTGRPPHRDDLGPAPAGVRLGVALDLLARAHLVHRGHSGEVRPDWYWEPAAAVVLVIYTRGSGSQAARLRLSVTFHADPEAAGRYLVERPELVGVVVDHATAVELARRSFEGLLS